MDNMRELVISGDTYRSSDAMLSQQEERMLESSSVQTIVRTPFLAVQMQACNDSRCYC